MSTKTFTDPTNDSNELIVDRSVMGNIRLTTDSTAYVGISIAPSDAPALMQAIGDCLPPIPDTVRDGSYEAFMSVALEYLGKAVRALEAETAEAEAQAKLEAEALELRKAWKLGDGVQVQKFEDLIEVAQEKWLAVARRAREMRAEK